MDAIALSRFNYEHPPTKPMPRTREVIKAYQEYMNTSGPKVFQDDLKTKLQKNKYYFCKNNFPYDVESPIQHSCLWYSGKTSKRSVIKFLEDNNIEYITFFENLSHLKSVKDISHFHVFHY